MAPNAIKRLTCFYSWISLFKFWVYITTYMMSLLHNPFQTLTFEYSMWKKPGSQCSLPAPLLSNLPLYYSPLVD